MVKWFELTKWIDKPREKEVKVRFETLEEATSAFYQACADDSVYVCFVEDETGENIHYRGK